MEKYNTSTLVSLISDIDVLIGDIKELSETKKQKINSLFSESMNSVIAIYIETKEVTDGGSFKSIIKDIITDLKEKTEKESIHKILDIIEFIALNNAIKHNLIGYKEAKKIFVNKELLSKKFITMLKNIVEDNSKKYNSEVNKIINLAIAESDNNFINDNKLLFNHLSNKSDKELIDIKRIIKLIEAKNKNKNKED